MKRMSLAVAAVAFSLVAIAGSVPDEVKALRATIASNSVDRTVRCRYYMAWYRDQCAEAEREAILERNVAAHRRIIELQPKNLAMQAELGIVLAIGGRDKDAEKVLAKTMADEQANPGRLDQNRLSESRWALAECLWRKGDVTGAKKLISDIATMPWTGEPSRTSARAKAMFLHGVWTDPDADLDMFKLPHSTDGKPFPTPQKAEYGEKKVGLGKVEIRFRTNETDGTNGSSFARATEDKREDPIVRLLKKKLTRFGTKFEKGGTKITIEISPDAPVDKSQGYSLDVAKGNISIKARSRLGATYGAVSLLQCIDREKLAVAECSIRDWPKLEKRGVIAHWELGQLEYWLFHKMSYPVVDMFRPEWGIVFSPLDREVVRQTARRHNDFGIPIYWTNRWIIVDPMLPLTAPNVHAMHSEWMHYAAAIGAKFVWEMDDSRFPMLPADMAAAGTAANLDAKHIDKLYHEVKAKHPDFKMMFGPPFYFGPDGGLSKNQYTEPRDPYLKSIAEFLDPEIDVYWSGPRCKSLDFTPEKIKWFSDLIGRKQVVFHNADAVGRHNYESFGADVPGYKDRHCPETLDLIEGFCKNTTFYNQACEVGPAMDWCWNPDAHDATEATRRTIAQLEGPGVFEILSVAIPPISYLDKYSHGRPRSELFTEDQSNLDKLVADGEDAWRRVMEIAKNGGLFVSGFNRYALEWARRLAEYRRNPPKWLVERRDAELANTSFAKSEVGFDESRGDQFLPAELIQGGHYFDGIKDMSDRTPCGSKELQIGETVSGRFAIEQFPPETPPKLIVVGQAMVEYWDRKFKVELPDAELEVNGRVVWRGKMFADGRYKPCEIELPVYTLLRDNTFSIRHTGPDVAHKRRPMVHYVVIRK